MKVLVTGASGFLGAALCVALENRGDDITRIGSRNHNLLNSAALDGFTEAYDYIFHLAAWTQAGDFCLHHPGEQWIINQQINTTVLGWWARLQKNAKLIAIGTSCAYDPQLLLTEENYLAGVPIDGLYTYAMTKRMLHIGQLAIQRQYGLRCLTLVPSTLYGPGYRFDGRQTHFIFDLIRKISRAKITGEKVVLWGNGMQQRELVHVNDFVKIALRLAICDDEPIINVGAGEEHSIRHFAGKVCELLGYDPARIEYDPNRYVGASSKCLNTDRLRRLCPGMSMTELNVGLKQTIGWYLSCLESKAS